MQARVFVGGDKASVGKSSVCLGLLGCLLKEYQPHELGYIKPVTQSTADTLIAKFCHSKGISYRHIGPVVFYKGFTREFLSGATVHTTESLISDIQRAVDEIAYGKRVVVIDGVGYPSVGSICGISNAVVAKSTKSSVLLVGKSGVGDAIDSYNLCATYFLAHQVPVIGAVFNKFQSTGFYSLSNCKPSIERWFEAQPPDNNNQQQKCYGSLPLFEGFGEENEACSTNSKPVKGEVRSVGLSEHEGKAAVEWAELFAQHVNVGAIVKDAVGSHTQ
eukprot:c7932_g1_i2.p1 GENE.c7932_g1_i2~~c7932_g1_i2.p1  ORF type:complete len:275 (+),score=39.39 c7932_g1_i2:53-877(+)